MWSEVYYQHKVTKSTQAFFRNPHKSICSAQHKDLLNPTLVFLVLSYNCSPDSLCLHMYSWSWNIMTPHIHIFLSKHSWPFLYLQIFKSKFSQLQIRKSIFAFPQQIPSSRYPDANGNCCLDCMWLNLWMQMAAVKSKVTLVFSTVLVSSTPNSWVFKDELIAKSL